MVIASPPTETVVPFLDLRPSHALLESRILAAIGALMETGAFTNGPDVAAFEASFADYCKRTSCVGVASGLDALRLALLAAGIGRGDEVVVPAMTFVATVEAVVQAGATPVLADISDDDFCLDPDSVRAAIGPATRMLLPVHLYGQMADMRALALFGIPILEDACQAHGAQRDGLVSGAAGWAAAFSFYPGKNLGAFGDGGALVTNDESLAASIRALREHGQIAKYEHASLGFTSRLDTIQALVLRHKLPLLDVWNDDRRRAAAYYTEMLAGVGDLELPPTASGSSPVWHLYVVRTGDPGALADHLRAARIGSGFHYPTPVHLCEAYRDLGYSRGAFPVSEELARRALSLPIYPGITERQLETVVTRIRAFF